MHNPKPRSACVLLALIAILALSAAGPARPAQALAAASPQLASSPSSVAATVALGASSSVSLTLSNSGGSSVQPRLYTALAAAGPAANLAVALPDSLARVALPAQSARIDAQLQAELAADPQAPQEFIVFLAEQADLSAAYQIGSWAERGAYVYRALKGQADRSQGQLRGWLAARGLSYRPLWIVNALAVRGSSADVAALAGRADVALLRANHTSAIDDAAPPLAAATAQPSQIANCNPNAANACWNIAQIGADRVWANFGVRGAGITVANIDSGVRYDHPALVGQYRGNQGGSFDHNYNWYDPFAGATTPSDSGNHGTHTMGSMVAAGGASAAAPAVGVAPGARWLAARACSARECSEVNLILAAQWLLAPTDLSGANPRPDLRPQIINNSWSSGSGNNSWYAGYVSAWRAAGIFPVFAAGNTGSANGCGSVQSPGDYAQVVGVGAIDSGDSLASFSSIGPSASGTLKPDITAPGSAIVSTYADFDMSYGTLSGTSMATPQVVGAVALLWSANPSLIGDYDRTYQILAESARPIVGDARFEGASYAGCHTVSAPNNVYGYGRLDAYAAVAEATVDVPWLRLPAGSLSAIGPGGSSSLTITLDARRVAGPGTYTARVLVHSADLSQEPLAIPVTMTVPASASQATLRGSVTRASDGAALGATITVAGASQVRSATDGSYQLVLPASSTPYTVTAQAADYAPLTKSVRLGAGQNITLDFALSAEPPPLSVGSAPLTASVALGSPSELTLTLQNQGTRALSYTASLQPAWYGAWRSDQPDGPAASWISPPANATTLPLADDGVSSPLPIGFGFRFFDQTYSAISITANGVISFSPLASTAISFITRCQPANETPNAALSPLRVDLDPSQAGARISYARLAAGFLVSWEDVPLFSQPSQRVSFQTLLRPDGRVVMNYKHVGDLPASASASYGLQRSLSDVQALGCKGSLRLSDGLTIELRPQPEAALWASLPILTGSIAPGQRVSLPVRLRWVSAPVAWPLSAEIQIDSQDSLYKEQQVVRSVRMSPIAVQNRFLLPIISTRTAGP